jgi:hypothetical protein
VLDARALGAMFEIADDLAFENINERFPSFTLLREERRGLFPADRFPSSFII